MIADVSFSCIDLTQFLKRRGIRRQAFGSNTQNTMQPLDLMATMVDVMPVACFGVISTNLRNALISSSNRRAQQVYR